MTEYSESTPALGAVFLLLPSLVTLAATIIALVWTRSSVRRLALTSGVGLLVGIVTFGVMLWPLTVSVVGRGEVSCDQAFLAATLHGFPGNAFPAWAQACRDGGIQRFVFAAALSIVYSLTVLVFAKLEVKRRRGE